MKLLFLFLFVQISISSAFPDKYKIFLDAANQKETHLNNQDISEYFEARERILRDISGPIGKIDFIEDQTFLSRMMDYRRVLLRKGDLPSLDEIELREYIIKHMLNSGCYVPQSIINEILKKQ